MNPSILDVKTHSTPRIFLDGNQLILSLLLIVKLIFVCVKKVKLEVYAKTQEHFK